MIPSTILDLGQIAEAVTETTGVNSILYVRQDIQVNKWFYHEGLALQFQQLGEHKYAIHIFGKSLETLKDTRKVILEAGLWMGENTDCTCVLAFCKDNDRRLKFLIRACGGEKIGRLPEADGNQDEILYVFTKERMDEYRRLICHK